MKLSMKWLSDYVDLNPDMPIREFGEKITMTGSKVESYSHEGNDISGVVVGKVLSVKKHPNADHLVVCSLDTGAGEPVQIVTGASNVTAGAYVPAALPGAVLPGGVKIKKGKLRGEASNGMMCSLGELSLSLHDFPYAVEDGIFILDENEGDCTPGLDIRKSLGLDDTVVEFEITPNRPDCLSVLGLAREAAATFDSPLTMPEISVNGGAGSTADYIKAVVHDVELCPRYSARAVKNVRIAPSPRWMRERLRASGVRPINNIVDITNYVMLEYGQPMHAFDYRLIKGGVINVRRARHGEVITTLDGVRRNLTPDMLVIADEEKPTAVAGVMGGENSGINADTSTVVFESAMFDASSIRAASKKLGLRTEASSRYEKGLDANGSIDALSRACHLVERLGAGEVCGDFIDIDNSDKSVRTVPLDPSYVNRFLGTEIPAGFMEDALRKLGFGVENGIVSIPSFRRDVSMNADIAEEVARMYGYDKIPISPLPGGSVRGGLSRDQRFEESLKSSLTALGFSEISTYSFLSPKYYDRLRVPDDSELRRFVRIRNPLGEDTGVMRTMLIPSMMDALSRNYSNRNMEVSLFELGAVYLPMGEGDLPEEKREISIGMYGGGTDFFTFKGFVEELFTSLFVGGTEFAACRSIPFYHPGRCARICTAGHEIGVLGEIHPSVAAGYGMDERVYVAELNYEMLFKSAVLERKYEPVAKFPSVQRDIAVICNDDIEAAELEKAIKAAAPGIVEKIKLFDIYRGEQIENGKKSVAFSVTMRAKNRTLTEKDADGAVEKILTSLGKLGAELRS